MNKAISAAKVQIAEDGPYLVSRSPPLFTETIGVNSEGESVKWKRGAKYPTQATFALCRCGASQNKPFCDRRHAAIGFQSRTVD